METFNHIFKIFNHLIEWIGVLFLSVEAIKLDNLKKLIDILSNFRAAINSKYLPSKPGGDPGYILIEWIPNEYLKFRRNKNIIIYGIGIFSILLTLLSTHMLVHFIDVLNKYVFVFQNNSLKRKILNGAAAFIIFVFAPYILGNEIAIWFSKFAEKYYKLMIILEKNTYNGIVGSIGFALITISALINIICF